MQVKNSILFVLYDNRAAFNKQQLFFPSFPFTNSIVMLGVSMSSPEPQ